VPSGEPQHLWVSPGPGHSEFLINPDLHTRDLPLGNDDPDTGRCTVQGVLALADQPDDNLGGFQCRLEFYRYDDTWNRPPPADRHHFQSDDNRSRVKVPWKRVISSF